MIDSPAHLDLVDAAAPGHPEVRVCLDVDASLRVGPAHLGVRRSPVRTADQARDLARRVADRPGFALVGVMFYDAQVAGLPDSSPAVRLVKRASHHDLHARRREVVDAVRQVADLELVNAGGTGSLHSTGTDPVVTELTAGSGLFGPTLFDGYDDFRPLPAAAFALSVVRKPTDDIATLFSGGYVASGPAGRSRLPQPAAPAGLRLLRAEGAGEVQTPVTGDPARALRIGDRVWMRYAKAGEMCERFDTLHLLDGDGVEPVPTYRGEGRNFG
jgi:D-serine deaminase-like pyridoxal phosphate-dependent protein